ncbi:hypothetical protein LIA77_03368 [Sarocladium implicatum]|nr:hypothetical protein LIA77_03368 [Sarocladium implicatum]
MINEVYVRSSATHPPLRETAPARGTNQRSHTYNPTSSNQLEQKGDTAYLPSDTTTPKKRSKNKKRTAADGRIRTCAVSHCGSRFHHPKASSRVTEKPKHNALTTRPRQLRNS